MLGTTVAAMILGGILIKTIEPRQEVGAKLLVELRSSTEGKSSAAREKEFLPTQAEVIRSPSVISSAIRHVEPEFTEAEIDIRVLQVAEQLQVDPLAGTNILRVRYADETSQRAADLVNALIDGYREYLSVSEQQQKQEILHSLQGRESELQAVLADLQLEHDQLMVARANGTTTDGQTSARILAGLEESLATTQSRRLLLERTADQIHAGGKALLTKADSPLSPTGDSSHGFLAKRTFDNGENGELPSVLQNLASLSGESWTGIQAPAGLETNLADATRRVNELTVALGPQHPELLAARATVTRYEQELLLLAQTAPARIQLALNSQRIQEESLQQRYDGHLRLTREAEVLQLKESRKLEEISRAEQASESLQAELQQYRLAHHSMPAGQVGIAVTVLEPPIPAPRLFAANPMIVMGISGLLGLLFGVSLLVIMPQISSRLSRLPQDGLRQSVSGLRAEDACS
ncbi:MAG: hypothetical protein H7Z17_12865 [Fuerstia sp.]|nr:hypothetical protein [Fuerstiella sp.]